MKFLKVILIFYLIKLSQQQCIIGESRLTILLDIETNLRLSAGLVEDNQAIRFACIDSEFYVRNINQHYTEAIIVCGSNGRFTYNCQIFDFEDFSCQVPKCLNTNSLYSVGIRSGGRLIETYRSCYNHQNDQVLYTTYNLYPDYVPSTCKETDRGVFNGQINDGTALGSKTIDFYYKEENYKVVFQRLLGMQKGLSYLINQAIHRGHNVPYCDFKYDVDSLKTMSFINAAPQWRVFNSGGWNRLEKNIRQYSKTQNTILNIITGTYGVLELYGDYGYAAMYLGANNHLPIPKYFWKVIYDPKLQLARAIVLINDPFLLAVDPDLEQINTCKITFTPGRAYFYCMTINQLMRNLLVGYTSVFDGISMAGELVNLSPYN